MHFKVAFEGDFEIGKLDAKYTILPKVLDRPLLMNRFDYFSNFYEYKYELVFGEEFLAQGLHLQSHQRC